MTTKTIPLPRIAIALPLLVTALIVLVLAWDWNWLKPLVERQASAAVGRKVSVQHLQVELSRQPLIVAEGITLANPEGFDAGTVLLTVKAVKLKLDADALLDRKLRLPEITVDEAKGDLYRNAAGQPNWNLALAKPRGMSLFTVEPGRLIINQSGLHFRDPGHKADFTAQLRTLAGKPGTEDALRADLEGRYNGQPISGYFQGGSLLGLRDAKQPYAVTARLKNGATELALDGEVEQPLVLGGTHLKLDLAGPDMAALYPLTGIPLAPTPPYQITTRLAYTDQRLQLGNIQGRVGSSDLSGALAIQLHGPRPRMTGTLHSQKVLLTDLGGFTGGNPSGEKPAEAATAADRVLPADKFDLPKLRAADIELRYHADQILGEKMPLDDLDVLLTLDDGQYGFAPLRFGVGKGEIAINMKLDGRAAEPLLDGEVKFKQVDAHKLLEAASVKGAGTMAGRISLKARGNSVAQMLAGGNGEMQLFMQGGNLSALLVNLAGLDLGNSVISLLRLPSRAEVRCMIGDFGLKDGMLQSRTLLVDTSEANLLVNGALNFKDESLDYSLRTQPKRPNIGSLSSPILIRGSLKSPSVRPDLAKLGTKGALAAALGVAFAPLAALIPTIQLGLGKDNNCLELVSDTELQAKTTVTAPPPKKKRHKKL